MSTFYIAKSRDHPLRKVWKNVGGKKVEVKPPFPSVYDFEPVEVGCLNDAFELHMRLTEDPLRAIVKGKPKVAFGARSAETFDDCETDFMIVDLDSVPERETTQATIINALPFLHGKAFVYTLTGSYGFKPGLRSRVIFRIEPATLQRQKFIAEQYEGDLKSRIGSLGKDKEGEAINYIDPKVFTPSGLIYTARPELIGIEDENPVRVFKVDGDETPIAFSLPKTVKIQVAVKRQDEAPKLVGFIKGNRHNSIWPYTKDLKRFMGHNFEDKEKRLKYFLAAMTEAGASDGEIAEFTPRFKKCCVDRRLVVEDTYEIEVIANEDNSVPLEIGERLLREGLQKAIASFNDVSAFIVTTGVGKTKVVLDLIAAYNKINQLSSFLTYYYLPTIEMCEQACKDAKKAGLNAMVRRGRGQELDGEPMCKKYKAVKVIEAIDLNISEHVCKNEEYECPYFHTCAWQQQKEDQKRVEIVFLPHAYLVLKQKTQQEKPNLIIIDEAPWISTLTHTHSLELKELCKKRHDMHEWVQLFERLKDDLTLDNLKRNGFTEETFHAMGKAEEALKPGLKLNPSMGDDESFKAVNGLETKWYEFKRVWKALERSMHDGNMNRVHIEDGRVYTHWRSEIDAIPKNDDKVIECPVIILDATAQESVIRAYMPLDAVYHIEVKPHPQSTFTHIETSGSMSSYLYGIRGDENDTIKKRIEKARKCRDRDRKRVESLARVVEDVTQPAVWLTYKALEEHEDYELMGHFGALEGLNKFEDHNALVSGRPLPSPYDLENIAAAVFQNDPRPIQRIKLTADNYWFPSRNVAKRGGGFINTEYHPDERVEAIRKMICDGQVMQAAGRTRYVRHPVHVVLVNQLALPLTFTRTIKSAQLEFVELESKKVLPMSQSEALRLYPALKDSRKAARILRPLVEQLTKEDALFFEYRRKGARGPLSVAIAMHEADLSELGDIETSELEMVSFRRHNTGALIRREVRDMLVAGGVAWLDDEALASRGETDVVEAGVVHGEIEFCWTEVTDDEDGGFYLPLKNWRECCGTSSV